jgi:hypothetical protein
MSASKLMKRVVMLLARLGSPARTTRPPNFIRYFITTVAGVQHQLLK